MSTTDKQGDDECNTSDTNMTEGNGANDSELRSVLNSSRSFKEDGVAEALLQFSKQVSISAPNFDSVGVDETDKIISVVTETCNVSSTQKSEIHPESANDLTENDIDYFGSIETSSLSKTYKCDCGELFGKQVEFAAHKRWTCKLVEKNLECSICKMRFANIRGLKRHMKHLHKCAPHAVFECSVCSDQFHNRIKLTRHWMEFHYDENDNRSKLKCFYCDEDSFSNKFELESHLLVHKYDRINQKKLKEGDTLLHNPNTATNVGDKPQNPELIVNGGESDQFSSIASSSINCQLEYGLKAGDKSDESNQNAKSHTTIETIPFQPTSDLSAPNVLHPPSIHSHLPHQMSLPLPSSHPFFPSRHHDGHHHHHRHHGKRHHHRPPLSPHHSFHHHLPPHTFPYYIPPSLPQSSEFQLPLQWPPPVMRCPKKLWKLHHHKKWKWKKYLKDIMMYQYCGNQVNVDEIIPFIPQPTNCQASDLEQKPSVPSSNTFHGNEVNLDSNSYITDLSVSDNISNFSAKSSGFKMACTFCGQMIESGNVQLHRIKECPVLSTIRVKCPVCHEVFRKRHKLLKHMSEYDHFLNASVLSSEAVVNSSSVSNLEERLDSVLQIHPDGSSPNSTLTSSSPMNDLSRIHTLDASDPNTTTPTDKTDLLVCGNTASMSAAKTINVLSNLTNDVNVNRVDHKTEPQSKEIEFLHNKAFQCAVCRSTFDSKQVLSYHLQSHITHASAVQKVYEWNQKSILSHDDSGTENSSVLSFSITDSVANNSVTTAESSIPSEANTLDKLYAKNINIPDKFVTDTDSEKWLKPHKRMKERKQSAYPCEICDETFHFRKELSTHMKQKHNKYESSLVCPVCHKKFSWRKRGQFYERHLSSHYGISVFKHKCGICGKTFLEKCKLQDHMANHKTELLHKCDICNKGYSTKSSLARHMRQHKGDKPHKCEECSASFLEKRELLRHMSDHTGLPAFMCQKCGQGFTLKTSLDTHIKRKHND